MVKGEYRKKILGGGEMPVSYLEHYLWVCKALVLEPIFKGLRSYYKEFRGEHYERIRECI